MAKRKSIEPAPVYQLKITLAGTKPPIWRRVLVPANATLAVLHDVVQAAMPWTDSHMHQFIDADENYYARRDMELEDAEPSEKVEIRQLLREPKDSIGYEYDFGDSWEHEIVLEKILEPDPKMKHPICTAGKGHAPPEDCGGVWGYMELLKGLKEEDEEALELLDEDYDPEEFDLDKINKRLEQVEI